MNRQRPRQTTAALSNILQRINSDTQRHAEIAKLVKLLYSPLHTCCFIVQYKALEADRKGFLECILIGRRTRVIGYRLSGFAGGLIHQRKFRESIARGRRTRILGYRVRWGRSWRSDGFTELNEYKLKNDCGGFQQILNVDNLIAEPPNPGDMLDRLHIPADFESMKKP